MVLPDPSSPVPKTHDHVPPLLRGLGFSLVLHTSLVVGVAEHRQESRISERVALLREQVHEDAAITDGRRPSEAIARELRLLRLQLQEQDLAERVFENRWFQLLGILASALIAASFLYEARLRWPHRARD